MVEVPTIGVLSPFAGGPYFGGVIAGIARSVRGAGQRMLAVQTLDAGCATADRGGPPPFQHPVAWGQVAGFVVIQNAVSGSYLQALRASGKPVVVVGHEYDEPTCPTVLPDNGAGVKASVEHLIAHGHRNIAFLGYLGAHDIRERYVAYVETMRANGIEPDPRLCYEALDNSRVGPTTTATILDSGVPFTALITGTDANGLDLLRLLNEAGYQVPTRVAMIGFDDVEEARYSLPTLSSVRQPLRELGVQAYQLLAATLAGEVVPAGRHLVPTALILRESCGCSDRLLRPATTATPIQREAFEAGLTRALGVSTAAPVTGIDAAAKAIMDSIDAAANGEPLRDTRSLHTTLTEIDRTVALANLDEIAQIVRRFAATATRGVDQAATAVAVERRIQDVLLKIAQAGARGQYGNSTYFQSALSTQYVVSMDLLRSHEKNPRTLEWLAGTEALGGYLGQWTESAVDGRPDGVLEVVGCYSRERPTSLARGTTMPVSEFPPQECLSLADADGAMVFVIPVRSDASDWGMLAVVDTIESAVPSGRETINQWAALLNVALDHDAVLRSLRDQEDRLRRAALYDELTGLPNRVLFLERLRQAVRRMRRRSDYQYAVLFLDLDGFKVINDSMGHSAGDQLLVHVAERIRKCLREVDVAARFGGDEFLVLLEDLARYGDPLAVVQRLHTALGKPFRIERQDLVVSVSIGIALGSTRYEDAEEVLRDADIAMYTAKARQKGSHAIFDVAMHTRAVDRMQIEAELRQGLERGELEVHYQPIVELRTGRASAFEALVRWRHPERGLLGPDLFLPIAEESGMMVRIGRWVLQEACGQLDAWDTAGLTQAADLRISVNVSNGQFWHGGLVSDIEECLRSTRLDSRRLSLEITEGVIMHNVELARKQLEDIHRRGVELHIDDFGTGYSSLEALHHLPIDALKIDRSFVARLGSDDRSRELVRTIVLMGGNLGLELIAEGIETQAHQDQLRSLGTTYGQGFWFSRPVPSRIAGQLITGMLPPER